MAELTPKQKLKHLADTTASTPIPKVPKIPQAILERHPETAQAWQEYNLQWEQFFKEFKNIG